MRNTTAPAKLRLLLLSLAFSVAMFLGLDWFHSSRVLRSQPSAEGQQACFGLDKIRHHALQKECSCVRHWGHESYDFATNSLGFRDTEIRKVPRTDVRPRVLLLGDSFTEGMIVWPDSYVGQIAGKFPQYDFLNGGVESYSPSNYLNVARMLLADGVEFDEVIVFIDISDVQDEAAFYRDAGASGEVSGPQQIVHDHGWYTGFRLGISKHLLLTNSIFDFFERSLVQHGWYHLNVGHGEQFDQPRAAWTYRAVSETEPYDLGYGPLGVERGIAKEKEKMTLLWQELEKRGIPISVVVYPWPAQIAHDTVDSRQVRMWREWCEGKCKHFLSVFPAFFAAKEQCPRSEAGCWYLQYFIFGDEHYNAAGNALVADAVSKSLEAAPPKKRDLPISSKESGPK